MIAPREARRSAPPAKKVLVVGMAPSRAGHHLDGPTFNRLSTYAGVEDLGKYADLCNLLSEWPGEAESEKWDRAPDVKSWEVGQRVAYLEADLMERPRGLVVGLGGTVRDALAHWAGTPALGWLDICRGSLPQGADLVISPHPAGTNMWWNDESNRTYAEAFWHAVVARYSPGLRSPRRKVPMVERSRWLVNLVVRLQHEDWPTECVDWPFVDPAGRPQALSLGESVPATHLVLTMDGQKRPSSDHQALHSCDRGENCVNLAHLRWGTELENRLDQVDRGRGSIGKLGIDGAKDVLKEFDAAVAQIARDHGVTRDAVLGIALGKSWDPAKWTRRAV